MRNDTHKYILIALTAAAVVLLVVSFILPPQGVIDSSVLAAVGELFAFAALWVGYDAIKRGAKAEIKHGDTTVTIHDDDTTD